MRSNRTAHFVALMTLMTMVVSGCGSRTQEQPHSQATPTMSELSDGDVAASSFDPDQQGEEELDVAASLAPPPSTADAVPPGGDDGGATSGPPPDADPSEAAAQPEPTSDPEIEHAQEDTRPVPLELVLSTACITKGEQMTLTVHTDPYVLASIVVNYADNDDHGQMENFQADANGTITWSWIVRGDVPPGDAFVLASAWDAAREKRSEEGVAEFTVAGPLGCP